MAKQSKTNKSPKQSSAKKPASKINLRPTAGHLLIEPEEAKKQTASGLYLPETSDEKPQRGKILGVGAPEITEHGATKSSPVKPGDIVIYKKWGGNEVKVDNKEYLFVKFEDILAVVAA